MKKLLAVIGVLSVAFVVPAAVAPAADEEDDGEPKYQIKEVMQKAHKAGLWKKVAAGKASEEEEKMLLEMYRALAKNKPPRGKLAGWKKRTGALVHAAELAVADKKGAGAALRKAVNCRSCHKAHRGK